MQAHVHELSHTPQLIAEPGWHSENKTVITDWFARQNARLLAVALYGFLAGYACFPGIWYQTVWLAVFALPAMIFMEWEQIVNRLWKDKFMFSTGAFLMWMTLRSRLVGWTGDYAQISDASLGLPGVLLLGLLLMTVWLHASTTNRFAGVGWLFSISAASVALLSVYQFYVAEHHWGERLQNTIVYQGLHPVCTGLGFGFAATWTACLWTASKSWKKRLAGIVVSFVLLLACFLTASRGAVVALVCGHVVLTWCCGWKRAVSACLLLAATAIVYVSLTPLVQHLWIKKSQFQNEPALTQTMPPEVAAPLSDWIQRGDSGRLQIYQAALQSLKTNADQWIGIGQWGTRHQWLDNLPDAPDECLGHLHSAFLSTFVHGGIVGLFLLFIPLAIGVSRAWRLAKDGQFVWIVLITFGCSSLLWDGQSLCSLTSLPLFETLIFWTPLTAAAAIFNHQTQSKSAKV